jgi:hypothetical protein
MANTNQGSAAEWNPRRGALSVAAVIVSIFICDSSLLERYASRGFAPKASANYATTEGG